MLLTIKVEYEPVTPLTNKVPFDQYLCAAPTRIFKRVETFSAYKTQYNNVCRILTSQIRDFTAKFIRDKFGLRLAKVLQLILKIVKYLSFEGR